MHTKNDAVISDTCVSSHQNIKQKKMTFTKYNAKARLFRFM